MRDTQPPGPAIGRRHALRAGFAVVLLWAATAVTATECPTVQVVRDRLDGDTQDSLRELDSRFSTYSMEIDLATERTSILVRFAFADQELFLDVFFAKYCRLVLEEGASLAPAELAAHLARAQKALYDRVPFVAIVADSRDVSAAPPAAMPGRVVRSRSATAPRLPGAGRTAGLLRASMLLAQSDTAETPDYIRDPPYVVTRANKHFVMVASVPSRAGAIREMKRLKSRAPQYDFVVYAPYQGNPNYAVMMATWVPYSVAKRALADAMRDVSKGSLIWSCRSEGDSC